MKNTNGWNKGLIKLNELESDLLDHGKTLEDLPDNHPKLIEIREDLVGPNPLHGHGGRSLNYDRDDLDDLIKQLTNDGYDIYEITFKLNEENLLNTMISQETVKRRYSSLGLRAVVKGNVHYRKDKIKQIDGVLSEAYEKHWTYIEAANVLWKILPDVPVRYVFGRAYRIHKPLKWGRKEDGN
jgi:hypothetical protein